ncbi:MAG: GntR family transcriptional regulator [Peptococcaceae bacterium]|jgi:DNA-binding GntR family transcriptional regulator|nr:GntR family transcriptional regulator [Peptococcaceae bacterium]MDH7525736.1 GntR family transcriptional regulator [Peptococcaceae bacterium]
MAISELNFINKEQFITTKIEAVYNVLRENIVNGNLKPGTRLVLKKIAGDLGVSEIPVREAIRMLEAQGLVTITPHTGAQVSTFSAEDAEEIFNIRSVLEGYAAKTALPNLTPEVMERLNGVIAEMRECIKEGDAVRYGLLNRDFHRLLYQCSPYKRLYKMIFEMWDGSERTRAVFAFDRERPENSLREHEDIMRALEEGDGEKVEQIVRKHKQKAGEAFVRYLNHHNT